VRPLTILQVCDFGLSQVKEHGKMLKDEDLAKGTPLWFAHNFYVNDTPGWLRKLWSSKNLMRRQMSILSALFYGSS
jgi:hypothetical protein